MRAFMRLLAALVITVGLAGCSSSGVPDGMPTLIPTVIKLTQGGAPLEGAAIALVPKTSGTSRWACGGSTDANGEAVIQTLARFPGAPAGSYKVTVYKSLVEDMSPGVADSPSVIKKFKTYSLVEAKYGTAETTTLDLDVNGSETVATFDVGAAVRLEEKSL